MTDAFVSTDKRAALALRMAQLGVRDADLVEKFILGSGSGGQKINKTSSCVYLKHLPSGIEIKCQQSRARDLNRFLARRELCERIAQRVEGARSRRQQEAEKIRRQKRRRSRRQKERMLENKKHHSAKKQLRGKAFFLALILAAGSAEIGRGEEFENVQHPTSNTQRTSVGGEMGTPIQGDPTSTLNVESRRLDVSESASPKMSRTQAIVLGVVEGVTEYLPVSSTGHLLLAQRWMGIGRGEGVADKEAADAYAVCIQAGAILAVLGLFFGRIAGIARGVFGADRDGLRLGINLAVAFAPAAVVGMLLANTIKGWLFGDGRWGLWPIVGAWFVGGVVILVYAPHTRGARPSRRVGAALEALTWRGALAIGVIQCLGMWPGVSRSLATILGGLLVGLGLSAAVEFSFLLGLITLSASTLVDALKYGPAIVAHYGPVTPLLGLVVAMLSAALAVKWMVGYLQRHGLALFGWYRLVLALVVAAWIVI